jgi:hypothetical protein
VRFVQGDEGEEHEVNMLPLWQNQIIRVREAFGREMISDDSQPLENRVIFVKSADGSPPGPSFERVMMYTFGDDPTEYHVRIHGGDTPATILEGLKTLHRGKNPETMMMDDAEMDMDNPVGEWFTRTGKSHFKVGWKMEKEYQRFWHWTRHGERNLGDEVWDGRRMRKSGNQFARRIRV